MSSLHEALHPIAWLEGRWHTEDGKGTYPNIPGFQYHEDLEFLCIGQPMFNFMSISRHPETKKPMHQERGFLRVQPGTNNVAFVVSHNFGMTSLEQGQFDVECKTLTLETENLARIPFAKPPYVQKIKRILKLLAPDTLEVVLYMATDNTPLTEHLKAVYKKVE